MLENILLIDDDSTTNHVNKRLLLRSGKVKNVDVVESGSEALEYLTGTFPEDGPGRPDLIFLDLKMNGMDGFGFLDAYLALPDSQKARLIVALTSSASFYDLDRLKSYSDQIDHLYKPLTENHLDTLMERLQLSSKYK